MQIAELGCTSLEGMEPQALRVTYWFEPPARGGPFTVAVRLRGRRTLVEGRRQKRETFEHTETVRGVPAGVGPVAVTCTISGVMPGEWRVDATAEARPDRRSARRGSPSQRLPGASASGSTAYVPAIRTSAPGAVTGAWPALVSAGVACGLLTQQVFARRDGLPAGKVLLLSLLAAAAGLVGAKAYYVVEHRRRRPPLLTAGMCIQGFVLAAVLTLVAGSGLLGISVGRVLDVSAPALLFGMTIGRLGCFFGGCCAGRPTTARWGLWASDRHVGLPRVPTQLMESVLALALGLAATGALVAQAPSPTGALFAASLAAYVLGRQLLFPLRDLPRNTARGRVVTAIAAGGVLALSLGLLVID